jgi:hypothetical protein
VTGSRGLPISFALLVVLVALAPVFALSAGRISPQLINIAVVMLLLLLPSAPEGDVRSSLAIFKPLTVAALLPAAWMLLQILPLPAGSIEHPVWRSAAAALPDSSLSGHISIDLGFTLRSLFGYLSLISLAFITCILTRNRERAETILATLCAITTFIALELLLFRDLAALKPANSTDDLTSSLVALSAFGVVLNLAFVVRAAGRYETRSGRPGQPVRSFVSLMLLGTTGAVICLMALISHATYDVLIDTAFGLVVVGLVILIRRLNLARWTSATLCAAVLVTCGGVVALRFAANSSLSPLFRFAKIQSADAVAATLRMIADANWTGSGVGTYQALAAIYRDADGAPGPAAINTIASIVLEWGRTGMLMVFLLVIQLLVKLFRGALARGRDSFYATAAAACLVIAFCEAFCDASLTTVTVQMTAAIIVGLGLAQTTGRKAS